MDIETKLLDILENGTVANMNSFLTEFNPAKCKQVKLILQKSIGKHNSAIRNNKNIFTNTQREVLQSITRHCYTYDELKRQADFMRREDIFKYIPIWYKKEYVKKYLNQASDIYINYPTALELMDKDLFMPTKEYLADIIVYGLTSNISHSHAYKEHIWYLFEYETALYVKDEWLERFKIFISQKKIPRNKVLQESLLTCNRNFNKPSTGWFFKLFTYLEPREEELITLQNELFLALGSPHSKPVGDTLKYLKKIAKHSDFQVDRLIENIPLVLGWNVKSIVTSMLTLIDTLIKIYPKRKEELALSILQALAQEDESLQIKTIKLLAKHKLLDTQSILDEIAIYSEGLYHSTKQLLPEFEEVTTKEETIEITPHNIYERTTASSILIVLMIWYFSFQGY